MTDRTYIISRTLENKIAIAENNGQNTLLVTLDVLKEILALLKEQEPVHCKDCLFHNAGENEVDAWNRCRLHSINVSDDEFCSWAVKQVKLE